MQHRRAVGMTTAVAAWAAWTSDRPLQRNTQDEKPRSDAGLFLYQEYS
jgi:hypothetical protein